MIAWPVLMLLQNILAGIFALQSRQLAARYQSAHFQILSVVLVITWAIFLGYAFLNWTSVSVQSAANFAPQIILTGLAFTIWAVLTFITFRFVDTAVGSLFATLNLVAAVLFASFAIQETLSPWQLVGALLLFFSIIFMLSAHLSKQQSRDWAIGLILTVVASVFVGAAIASEKYLLNNIGMPTYSVFGIAGQTIPLIVLALIYRPKQFALFKNFNFSLSVMLMGLVRGAAGLLFVLSLVLANNASLVGALSGLKIILATILAAIFLHETQLMPRKLLAATIAFIGVGIMVW